MAVRRLPSAPALLAALVALPALVPARPARAGCGCEKPPPPPAEVRPSVAYVGAPVTLFSPHFVAGQAYTVTFTPGVGGAAVRVEAVVTSGRDLGDGSVKPQLVVRLPALPLGPASISARRTGQAVRDVFIDDAAFTVAPPPLALAAEYGAWTVPGVRGAVGRDGIVYLALDLTRLTKPMVLEAQATSYPLRFTAEDVVFKNVQGFLMQLLVEGEPNQREPVPGMFVLAERAGSPDSDVLHYSRHEFVTYFLQHGERQPHAVDPSDANWHLDGTRHIDHDHLVLAIAGHLPDGTIPRPGATPPFDLKVRLHSLFSQGLVGLSSVTVDSQSRTDSFDPATGLAASGGDVSTNGPVTVSAYGVVDGDAMGSSFRVWTTARITGDKVPLGRPMSLMGVKVPAGLPRLGSVSLWWSESARIAGPGSFQVAELVLGGRSTLYVDNSSGPVTLYVTGGVSISGNARILVSHPDPERFAIYVASKRPVTLAGSTTSAFYGVLYAPTSSVRISGTTHLFGAFVGGTMSTAGAAQIHYYRPLRGH
jgi:hypothetical protein